MKPKWRGPEPSAPIDRAGDPDMLDRKSKKRSGTTSSATQASPTRPKRQRETLVLPEGPDHASPSGAVRNAATRDPERTSAAILAAAIAEFSEKGLGAARIDAIAERAGINKRMLYHYFGDKEALYARALREIYQGIRSAERELKLESLDPVAGIRQ